MKTVKDERIPEGESRRGVAGRGVAFPIVAVAASAGGLDALRLLLSGIPADFGAAMLIVQHMAPRQRSRLAEILARHCALPVAMAREGQKIEKGHVLVAPPDRHLLIGADRSVVLSADVPVNFCRPSADRLFQSAISEAGVKTIAVVLTGTGQDGAEGMRGVKKGGGTTLVQSEESSLYKGMPRAAMETAPDFVVALEEMADTLTDLVRRAA